tara:strand:+ start:164 stop:607 length:444 start_codon:yes stop_codon:yes gene_type:complete
MPISKGQWKGIENTLKCQFHTVRLNCDGYEVSATLRQISDTQLGIAIYVNGELKGKWFGEDCEERRRFFRPVVRSRYRGKRKESLKKLGKRTLKQMGIDPDSKITYYNFYWCSAKSFIKHLIANNKSIEISDKTHYLTMEKIANGCV